MNYKNYITNLTIPDTFKMSEVANNQYMLIVQPGSNILDRLKRIQKKWAAEYGLQSNQLQSGYLLLARFNQLAVQEDRLLRKLHYAAMESAPYRINIEGFFGLPEHSIGLKLSNHTAVKLINRTIHSYLSGLRFPREKPYFNQYPAIGMVTKLESAQYRSIWGAFENRHFSASFIADHFIVLRKNSRGKGWSIIERFAFENIPVQSKQGVLFA